ncbi:hypothetical protein, partial [Sulfuricurvum sp.]|uniref:hypothetical protein n=1 Tax=Sulfuricurvum sp. TaxID=2025608 RepID=UPI003C4BCCE4
MTPSDFIELYKHRDDIRSVRFFPLFVSLIVLVCIPVIFENNVTYWLYALLLLFISWLFSELWVRFKQKIEYASELNRKSDFLREYEIYNQLLSEVLWDSERFKVN